MTPVTPILGVVLGSLCRRLRKTSSMSVPNLKQIALFVQNLLGVPKFRNWVTWPRPRPFRGRFVFRVQAGSVLRLCTKFEADSSFRSKVIKGSQNFKIWAHDPGQALLRVVLYTICRRGPSSISVPNLKRIALFIHKLLGGSQISPHHRPLHGGAGRPKFNQLQMITTFTYKPSLVRIDTCNFELSW